VPTCYTKQGATTAISWETRGGKGPYYTRSTRKNGRIVGEYHGCGEVAQLIALFDAEERAERAAAEVALRAEEERGADLDQLIANVDAATDTVTAAALLDAGCYQHHRQWRRRGNRARDTRHLP
jgi:hypothetical protein